MKWFFFVHIIRCGIYYSKKIDIYYVFGIVFGLFMTITKIKYYEKSIYFYRACIDISIF